MSAGRHTVEGTITLIRVNPNHCFVIRVNPNHQDKQVGIPWRVPSASMAHKNTQARTCRRTHIPEHRPRGHRPGRGPTAEGRQTDSG